MEEGVEAPHECGKASLVDSVERDGMAGGQGMGRWKRKAEDRASTELINAEEARSSGSTSTREENLKSSAWWLIHRVWTLYEKIISCFSQESPKVTASPSPKSQRVTASLNPR